MPRSHGTVRISSLPDEPFRYWVESWTKPDQPHVVELFSLGGNGECSCEDFAFHCLPNLREKQTIIDYYGPGHQISPSRTRCKHIYLAEKRYLRDLRWAIYCKRNPDADPDQPFKDAF